jgi:4-hydroxythreonine-4-phosphate dehydrogenase
MLFITLGDPCSINIRGVIQTLSLASQLQKEVPVVIAGSLFQWQDQISTLRSHGLLPETIVFASLYNIRATQELPIQPGLWFLDLGGPKVPFDQLSHLDRSRLSVSALEAVPSHLHHLAVVTGPVDKSIVSLTRPGFKGQTEFFSDLWGSEALMLLVGPNLKVGLATNHMPLVEVSSRITADLLADKVTKFCRSLSEVFGISNPRLALCGLNPHAGDQGLFGHEDKTVIEAFIKNYQGDAKLTGPISADTVFHFAIKGRYDGVLAMYHDQGLTPMKTMYFDEAINVSGGLPHLRVSPDHGPASDLILSSDVSFQSFHNAMALAVGYLEKRIYGSK